MTWAPERVLVTGHHGYIGSVTAPALSRAGYEVVGLDTFLYEGCDFEPSHSVIPELRADIRDVHPDDLHGFDAVVHLAALSNDPLGALDPALTQAINFEATVALAVAAKQAGVERFVFASSCSMYGSSDGAHPVDENAPLRPLTAYARSKASSEVALLELADDAFSPVFMRNATAYGVSPRLRVDLVVNNLVGWARTTGKIRILSDGTPWRPLIHVGDIAAATVALVQAPRELVHGQAYNIGSPDENYRVREIAAVVSRCIDNCAVEYAGTSDPDGRSYRVDFGKFAATFSHCQFAWTLARGARELGDAYALRPLTRAEFEGPRFTRLDHLDALITAGRLGSDLRWR